MDLACGVALGLVVTIDLFTAASLSLVAYVQPSLVGWVQFPGFVDYLFVSFCMSSTLGPGDAVPLARSLKLLMMLQVSLSLLVLVVLAARAIGLIG